jgi:hypothetical protein
MASIVKTESRGRRLVDNKNVNSGILRCPCCNSRMLDEAGKLVERYGDDQTLWIPRPKNTETSTTAATAAAAATAADAAAETKVNANTNPETETFTWEQDTHQWWWSVPDVDDFSNVGLSRLVESPMGPVKIVLCSECQSGPYGYTTDTNPIVWLCCGLLNQVDASEANDETDFKAPEGIDVAALRSMMESGALTTQFNVTFEEYRLQMMLSDDDDEIGVVVMAFTEYEGNPGPAELAGDIRVGDKVMRVNGTSTSGLKCPAVLTMIVEATRPITLHFERKGGANKNQQHSEQTRVHHKHWEPSVGDSDK